MEKEALIVEDDPDLAKLLSINLRDINCRCQVATDGIEGLYYGTHFAYDVIVLDVMLPKMNGFDVCQKLRAEKVRTPILMLTAKGEEEDKINAFELGADDYITKPFSIKEFIYRVKANIRRFKQEQEDINNKNGKEVFQHGPLTLNVKSHNVFLEGQPVEVTVKEFELLKIFMENPDKTFSRDELLEKVWGYSFQGYEHTVNSHINRLRVKIEQDSRNPRFIKTVWGVGYKFTKDLPG